MIDPNTLPYITREQLAFEQSTTFGLQVNVVATTTGIYELKGFTKEGPFTYTIKDIGDGQPRVYKFALPDLPIMVSLRAKSALEPTNRFQATISLSINETSNIVLTSGSPNGVDGITWPYQAIPNESQKHGFLINTQILGVAAGLPINQTIPANRLWRMKSITLVLQTDATVAIRVPGISFVLPSTKAILVTAGYTQLASTLMAYMFYEGGNIRQDTVGGRTTVPLILDLWLPPNTVIADNCTNFQAGDRYTYADFTYEEYLVSAIV